MSTLPLPSADQPPPASRLNHLPLRISLWGIEAAVMADALQSHAKDQAGWSERLVIHAHCHTALQNPSAMSAESQRTHLSQWIAHELSTIQRPHLSLLVPAQSPSFEVNELALRTALAEANLGFQVLYGATLAERLRNAANAVALTARTYLPSAESARFAVTDIAKPTHPRMRSWSCEKCSDPECEHRLFTGLTAAQ